MINQTHEPFDLQAPTPVLKPDALYIAHDQVVCAQIGCAGMTALYTGFTIGGARVTKVTARDVTEWAEYDLGPLRCEGGHLEAYISGRNAKTKPVE